jgi:hypothetical protein
MTTDRALSSVDLVTDREPPLHTSLILAARGRRKGCSPGNRCKKARIPAPDMNIDQTPPASKLSRRRFRRAAGVVGSLVPLGSLDQRVWAESRQVALLAELTNPTICLAAAAISVPHAPKAKPEQRAAMRGSRTHDHHPTGPDLTREIELRGGRRCWRTSMVTALHDELSPCNRSSGRRGTPGSVAVGAGRHVRTGGDPGRSRLSPRFHLRPRLP